MADRDPNWNPIKPFDGMAGGKPEVWHDCGISVQPHASGIEIFMARGPGSDPIPHWKVRHLAKWLLSMFPDEPERRPQMQFTVQEVLGKGGG